MNSNHIRILNVHKYKYVKNVLNVSKTSAMSHYEQVHITDYLYLAKMVKDNTYIHIKNVKLQE